MIKKIIYIFVAIILLLVTRILIDGGVFKSLSFHSQLSDVSIYTNMAGTEDLALDRANGLLFISSSDRWKTINEENSRDVENDEGAENGEDAGKSRDGIYILDLKQDDNIAENPIKLKSDFTGDFHPHGISFLHHAGRDYLFAINHNTVGDFVEVFEYQNNQLKHIKSYQNDQMCCPNDLVAVDVDKFYVTNDHGNASGIWRTLEEYLKLASSYVLYFDGNHYSKVVENLSYANGINISNNGTNLFVTEASGKKVTVMKRNPQSGQLTFQFAKQFDTGLDNISIDEEDNLWIGAHPKLLDFVMHAKDSKNKSPSQVLKLSLKDNDFNVEEVYLDNGEQISASSVAVVYSNEIFVGVVFENKLLRASLKGK